MRCHTHNYEYEFLGECPHCAAKAAAEEAKRQRDAQLAAEQAKLEQDRLQHEERGAALAAAEERRRKETLELEAQRQQFEEDIEFERQAHAERMEELRAERYEKALEQDRRARRREYVDTKCNAGERMLADGRYREALENAEEALDRDRNDWRALQLAYSAEKNLRRMAPAERRLSRLVDCYVRSSRYWSSSSDGDRASWLAKEAIESDCDEELFARIVFYHRGPPEAVRHLAARISRPHLFSQWLDRRIASHAKDKDTPPLLSVLEALASETDGDARIAILAENGPTEPGFVRVFGVLLVERQQFPLAMRALGRTISLQSSPRRPEIPAALWSLIHLLIHHSLERNERVAEVLACLDQWITPNAPPVEIAKVVPLAIEACLRSGVSYAVWLKLLRLKTPQLNRDAVQEALRPRSFVSGRARSIVETVLRKRGRVLGVVPPRFSRPVVRLVTMLLVFGMAFGLRTLYVHWDALMWRVSGQRYERTQPHGAAIHWAISFVCLMPTKCGENKALQLRTEKKWNWVGRNIGTFAGTVIGTQTFRTWFRVQSFSMRDEGFTLTVPILGCRSGAKTCQNDFVQIGSATAKGSCGVDGSCHGVLHSALGSRPSPMELHWEQVGRVAVGAIETEGVDVRIENFGKQEYFDH